MLGLDARRLSSAGSILCFHSLRSDDYPSGTAISVDADRFWALIRAVRAMADIVPLTALLRAHRESRSTTGMVALTFDDAYHSVAALGATRLAQESVPITVFVVAQAAAQGSPFWWDRLEDLALHVGPERWSAFERVIGIPSPCRDAPSAYPSRLSRFRQWMLSSQRGRWFQELEWALAELESEVGTKTVQRGMSWSELRRFASSPLVDVGVHTLTHPVLPLLGEEEVVDEVAGGFDQLRNHVAKALPVLAIPFGIHDQRTLMLARQAGMQASLVLGQRTLRKCDPLALGLPRLSLGNQERTWKLRLRLLGAWERLGDMVGRPPNSPPIPATIV